jgi:hypothetical protein
MTYIGHYHILFSEDVSVNRMSTALKINAGRNFREEIIV